MIAGLSRGEDDAEDVLTDTDAAEDEASDESGAEESAEMTDLFEVGEPADEDSRGDDALPQE